MTTATTTRKILLDFGLLHDQLMRKKKKKKRTKLRRNWLQKRLRWKLGGRISSRMVSSTTARPPRSTITMDTFSDITRQYLTPTIPTHIPTITYSLIENGLQSLKNRTFYNFPQFLLRGFKQNSISDISP